MTLSSLHSTPPRVQPQAPGPSAYGIEAVDPWWGSWGLGSRAVGPGDTPEASSTSKQSLSCSEKTEVGRGGGRLSLPFPLLCAVIEIART